MNEVRIKVINESENPLPEYATPGSSGMDLRANLKEPVTLSSFQRRLIPTGISVEIPQGYEIQIRPRSGLAIKNGITCVNSPGTVDSDYRGELKVILINLSDEIHTINHSDRIAQMVVAKVEKATLEIVERLEETKRGEGGFGHTGHN